jgi:hypothetical protein
MKSINVFCLQSHIQMTLIMRGGYFIENHRVYRKLVKWEMHRMKNEQETTQLSQNCGESRRHCARNSYNGSHLYTCSSFMQNGQSEIKTRMLVSSPVSWKLDVYQSSISYAAKTFKFGETEAYMSFIFIYLYDIELSRLV